MSLLEKLMNRLLSKKQDANTTYWAALTKAASKETLSERATNAMLDELDATLPPLGKTVADVKTDLELLRQLGELADAPAAADAARAEAKQLLVDAAAMNRRADERQAEIASLARTAQDTRSRARAVTESAEQSMQEFEALRSKLAAAGHPQFAALAANAAKQREVESLRGELVSLDAGMNASHEAPSTRRASIRTRLAELGVPLDDNDNAMDEPLPEEVGRG